MKKKLLSLLLSFMMIVSITASSFADELTNAIPRSTSVEDILGDILFDENAEVETKTSSIKLDTEKKYTVNADLSMIMYKFKLASDKSINLSYKSTSKLFEIAMVGSDGESAIWSDTRVSNSKEISNKVNLKLKKGEYIILVTATKGNYTISPKTTKTLKTMSPFTVKKVLPGATSLSGTGVAGAKVSVTTENFKTYTTTVKSDNTYKVTIPKQEEDSVLMIKIEKEGYGAKLNLVEVEYAKFSTFTVNQVKSTSTRITGKGKSGATVRAFVDGKKIGEATVKSDGTYSMKISKQSSGRDILVKMYKKGYITKSKTVTVKKVFTKLLTVNSVKSTQKTITGKGSKGATVRAYVNNKEIGKSTVKSNGTYSISIPKQSKKKVITVKMSKKGFASSSKSVTVK
ncbi:MAG: Ig-like domain-containing protein [Terrisporobacter othiniensis]|uniref:Ig-like domain-containing protein n=1 Tax=Terrisporobacter othiniensis TaxID=1577792 RepID=UPI002A75093D|nr:Ig-like domain-containing protein [Terrisporobacter othiniensis]MDY3373241.1 Ig-like domain-containing protein [Terrisporobacter othiniensis]